MIFFREGVKVGKAKDAEVPLLAHKVGSLCDLSTALITESVAQRVNEVLHHAYPTSKYCILDE